MSKKKENKSVVKTDIPMQEKSMEVAKVNFSFMFTRDEADKFINHPNSQVARNMRKYMCSIFEVAAKKMLEVKPDEIVKNCKLDIPEELQDDLK